MRVELFESHASTSAARQRPRIPSGPLLLLLLAALCCALPAGSARGQAKPNIAGDVESRKKTAEPPAKKPGTEARPSQRRRPPAAPRPPAPAVAAAPPLEVTFYTGLAEADVFLNQSPTAMYKLGRSGADGRLVARLPRGLHTVTASRPGSRIERRQIDVRPGSTSFVLNLSDAAPASPVGSNVAAPVTAGDVFRRYLDPKRTDGVTAAEWQLAQSETAAAFAANPLDPQVEAQALFARGQLAYLRRDFARAVLDFNTAALKLPNSALAYYGLGNAYLGAGRLGEAARAYQQAAQISPQLAMAYKGWGDVLARQNKNR
ncbi:MAG TPA: tetratricopeptide repeat protein, partial [Pyrinomonadaceae bacterium]